MTHLLSAAPAQLLERLTGAFDDLDIPVLRGATWTTDAPFRETEQAIDSMRERGFSPRRTQQGAGRRNGNRQAIAFSRCR